MAFFSPPVEKDFWALRNVSFQVNPGDTLGLVGPNGCGKSTLLQIVSGVLQPSEGRVYTRGRLAALLELGASFNPDFTGRENVLLNGEIIGLSRAEVDRAMPAIESFAEIGEFIDRPVKEYSSGMYVRLAFSSAIHIQPDILIVDEALAVGDAIFANRCVRKLIELRERRVTILFVSHDLGLVKQIADQAILLVSGRIAAQGSPAEVVNRYVALVLEKQAVTGSRSGCVSATRHGDRSSEILGVTLLDGEGQPSTVIMSGAPVCVRIHVRFQRPQVNPMIGILIRTRTGLDVYGTNTKLEGLNLGSFDAGEELGIDFQFDCWLTPQHYTLTAATQHDDGFSHDWLDDIIGFEVVGARAAAGVADLRAEVTWRVLR